MSTPSPSSPPRRRRLVAALVVAASVIAVPLTTGAPAGAAAAPLVTNEGLGIRVNETAILGSVLDLLEAEMQPLVDAAVYDGVLAHTGLDDPDWVDASFDFDLAADFVNAGTSGYPQGGLALTATIDQLLMRAYRYGEWWQPECLIHTNGTGPLTTGARVRVDGSALPAAPFTPTPSWEDWSATWPNESVAPGYSWACSGYIIGFDWAAFSDVNDPSSPVAQVLALVETTLADLTDQLWFDNVRAVMDSLTTFAGFAVSVDQVRTDNNGLIATADVDATGGVTVAGYGPYPVSSAIESGVSSNINSLLAQQTLGGVPSDMIVSLHPNVTNQHLTAVHDHVNGTYGTTPTSNAIATALVDPTLGACYTPGGWSTRLEAQAPAYVAGTAGAPEMRLPLTTVQFRNAGCNPADPRVATFTGFLDDIAVSATGVPLSPHGWASTATWTATRTQADAATAARVPPATTATLLPWAQNALATFLGSYVPGHIEMTPGGFVGQAPTHWTGGGSYTGDRRITETFHMP